jgi:hypothetical protein
MPLNCPYCAQENAVQATVCGACARDIVIPSSLSAERDDLAHKLQSVREELLKAKTELTAAKRANKFRLL